MTNLVSPFSVWVQSANDNSSTQVNIILDLVTNNHTYWKWIETDRGSPTTDRIKWTLDAVKNEARGEKCNCKNCMSKVNSARDMSLQWWEYVIPYMHICTHGYSDLLSPPIWFLYPSQWLSIGPVDSYIFVLNAFQIRAVKVEKSWNTSHHEYGHGHTRNNRKKITSNIKFLYFLCNVYAFRFISWEWFIITLSHFLMVVLLSLACLTNRVW